MECNIEGITADARALQERDEFRSAGWLKLLAPAKVNLFLGIGSKRPDGYHEAHTIMHALALHDTVYMRQKTPADSTFGTYVPEVRLVENGSVELPELSSDDNLASKAVRALQGIIGAQPEFSDVIVRIEKNIPFQGGLGGASTDAAAALVGAALLANLPAHDPAIEQAARTLGADVAFFLHGGCAYFEGTGDRFVHTLQPAKTPLVLIKPSAGVQTARAYQTFDQDPVPVDPTILELACTAEHAADVPLFNNLAPAAEALLPELTQVRTWVQAQQGVTNALLCGSGATTFALCDSMNTAMGIVAQARKLGWWARTTSLSSIGALPISIEDQQGQL